MKKRHNEQIIGLREADAGLPIKELRRKHGFSEPSYYAWKAGGMKAQNGKLKRLLANSMLEVDAMREVLKENGGRVGTAQGCSATAGIGLERTSGLEAGGHERPHSALRTP